MVSTPLKNMKVSWDDNSGYMEKMKFMFQTTNQITVALFVIKSPTEAPQRTAKARAEHGVGSPRTSAFFWKNPQVYIPQHTGWYVFPYNTACIYHGIYHTDPYWLCYFLSGCILLSILLVYWMIVDSDIYSPFVFVGWPYSMFFLGLVLKFPWNEGRIHTGKAGFYRLGLPRKLYHRQNMAKTWGFSSQHGTQNSPFLGDVLHILRGCSRHWTWTWIPAVLGFTMVMESVYPRASSWKLMLSIQ